MKSIPLSALEAIQHFYNLPDTAGRQERMELEDQTISVVLAACREAGINARSHYRCCSEFAFERDAASHYSVIPSPDGWVEVSEVQRPLSEAGGVELQTIAARSE